MTPPLPSSSSPAGTVAASKCPFANSSASRRDEHSVTSEDAESATPSSPASAAGKTLVSLPHIFSKPEYKQAIQKCPAFAGSKSPIASSAADGNKSCPFAQAKTSDDLQNLLVEVPKSHWERTDGLFVKSLQEFHSHWAVNQQHQQQQEQQKQQPSTAWNTCPVKQRLSQSSSAAARDALQNKSFSNVLEEYSVMAIMANLVDEESLVSPDVSSHKSATRDQLIANNTTDKDLNDNNDNDEDEDTSEELLAAATAAASAYGNNPSSMRLSQALHRGTAASHEQAEQVHFVRNFIKGKIDRNLYAHLIWNLYHVYKVLEECLDQHAAQVFPNVHFPHELDRTQTLYDDVDFWIGWDNEHMPPISPATQDYMDRLRHVANTNPMLLLSHAYTRYLGDLSGGKVLARVARRALQLDRTSNEGLAFYQFENVASAKLFKDKYRLALDELKVESESRMTDLVHEANVAFGLNVRIFEELDVMGGVVGSSLRPLQDIFTIADGAVGRNAASRSKNTPDTDIADFDHGNLENLPAEAECPFLKRSSDKQAAPVKQGECPWPFIFMHDPVRGIQKWQTWVVAGLALSWAYSKYTLAAAE